MEESRLDRQWTLQHLQDQVDDAVDSERRRCQEILERSEQQRQDAETMATMKEEELEALKKNVDRMLQEKEDVMENALIRQRKMLEKSHEEELECQKRGEQERLDAALRAAKNVFQQKIAEVESALMDEMEAMRKEAEKTLQDTIASLKKDARIREKAMEEIIKQGKDREASMSKNVAYMKNQMEALERLYEKEKDIVGRTKDGDSAGAKSWWANFHSLDVVGEEHRVIDAHERVAAAARSRAAEQQHKEREDARTKEETEGRAAAEATKCAIQYVHDLSRE